MSTQLTAKDRVILQRLFGWHATPWIEAFSAVLEHIRIQPSMVLEVGASSMSAPSMYFLQKGASVEVTCYQQQEVPRLEKFCGRFCQEHKLPCPLIGTYDIFAPSGKKYDVILMKGVLGGLDRKHDIRIYAQAINGCLSMLRPGGYLIVIDKGWCSALHNYFLRKFGAAGKNNWHYFSQDELESLSAQGPLVAWSGFASVGVMPFRWLQHLADGLDKYVFNRLLARRGTVFAALYTHGASSASFVEQPARSTGEEMPCRHANGAVGLRGQLHTYDDGDRTSDHRS